MKRLILLLPMLAGCLPTTPPNYPNEGPKIYDPLATEAWHLENTGQDSFTNSLALPGEDHKIMLAHQELGLTGKDVRIAVSDYSVQINHGDLSQNQLVGEHRNYKVWPYIGGDPSPIEDGPSAPHGTAVTGLLAAVKGNTIGSYGVAPDARFAGFNFLMNEFEPTKYLHQTQGDFRIFNYSYGASNDDHILSDYSSDFANSLKVGVAAGANYVKAAGNSYRRSGNLGTTIWGNANFEPEQTLPYFIVVGAVNARGKRASYSTPGSNLWISGAGGESGVEAPAMITTDLSGCLFGYAHMDVGLNFFDKGLHESNSNCDFTSTMSGTSSATPIISGIIALMLEANPELSWRDVKHILAKTADRVDYTNDEEKLSHPHFLSNLTGHTYDVKWTRNAADNYFSNWYGFGRANALKAARMALEYTFPLGTPKEVSRSIIHDAPIPDNIDGLESLIPVTSTITKIESVQLAVTVVHNKIGNLGIELTSPEGTTSRLFLINSNAIDEEYLENPGKPRTIKLLSNAFYEEAATRGNWKLRLINGSADGGELKKWQIKINGH